MITRIFRVRIDPSLRAELEPTFASVSVEAVASQPGSVSMEIGKPTAWAPDEYVIISRWASIAALREFAGEAWNEAHIPDGMAHVVRACWVHHYVEFDGAV